MCVLRIFSRGREDSFRDGLRARDGKCVLTGVVNLAAIHDVWHGFEAAHVFPIDKETLWDEYNFSCWITNTTGCRSAAIDSIQNGMLICPNLHCAFDSYLVSVNPDVSDLTKFLASY